MDDHTSVQVSIPTDDDGYVRQECPTCGREFKTPVMDGELTAVGHCPYCGCQDEHWFTAEQLEQFRAQVLAEVLPQVEKDLGKAARNLERSSGGLLKMDMKTEGVDVPTMAPEAPDMKIVASPCCGASLKIDEDWNGSTFCPSCGSEHVL